MTGRKRGRLLTDEKSTVTLLFREREGVVESVACVCGSNVGVFSPNATVTTVTVDTGIFGIDTNLDCFRPPS